MPSKYASGKHSIATCDRCGHQFMLKDLKKLTIKTKQVNIKVCRECWDPDHPQLQLGLYPVNDPQAVREPRPDTSYYGSGPDPIGYPSGGSRVIEWGWNPVGGASQFDSLLTPNHLIAISQVGTVTITTT